MIDGNLEFENLEFEYLEFGILEFEFWNLEFEILELGMCFFGICFFGICFLEFGICSLEFGFFFVTYNIFSISGFSTICFRDSKDEINVRKSSLQALIRLRCGIITMKLITGIKKRRETRIVKAPEGFE